MISARAPAIGEVTLLLVVRVLLVVLGVVRLTGVPVVTVVTPGRRVTVRPGSRAMVARRVSVTAPLGALVVPVLVLPGVRLVRLGVLVVSARPVLRVPA